MGGRGRASGDKGAMGDVHVERSMIVKVRRRRTWSSLVLVKMDKLDAE